MSHLKRISSPMQGMLLAIHGFWTPAILAGATATIKANIAFHLLE
jgi:hypothetical protein